MNDNPIGIFDSGVGGLSVLFEVQRLFPNEDLVYLADTGNCPYGTKSPDEIRRLSIQATEFLVDQGAKMVVVACNTASAAALASLRATFSLPFVGTVPAVKPASAATQTGKVGVIATPATCQAEVFSDLVSQFASGIRVYTQPCPGLVELVESGEIESPKAEEFLSQYLGPLLDEGIDTLVLGCTHYPFLRPTIERVVGPNVVLLDTGLPVAKQVGRILEAKNIAASRQSAGKIRLFTSGDLESFTITVKKLMKEAATWEILRK